MKSVVVEIKAYFCKDFSVSNKVQGINHTCLKRCVFPEVLLLHVLYSTWCQIDKHPYCGATSTNNCIEVKRILDYLFPRSIYRDKTPQQLITLEINMRVANHLVGKLILATNRENRPVRSNTVLITCTSQYIITVCYLN